MEDTLEVIDTATGVIAHKKVLILVLMEDTLEALQMAMKWLREVQS